MRVAPTLVKYAEPSAYEIESRRELRQAAAELLRNAAIAEARTRAQSQIEEAKADIAKDKEAAQTGLQGEVGRLASEIIRTVLQPSRAQAPAGGR